MSTAELAEYFKGWTEKSHVRDPLEFGVLGLGYKLWVEFGFQDLGRLGLGV